MLTKTAPPAPGVVTEPMLLIQESEKAVLVGYSTFTAEWLPKKRIQIERSDQTFKSRPVVRVTLGRAMFEKLGGCRRRDELLKKMGGVNA
ncbi:MAG: hypothetical protein AAFR17_12320 [Pseudomonadota bacterium]